MSIIREDLIDTATLIKECRKSVMERLDLGIISDLSFFNLCTYHSDMSVVIIDISERIGVIESLEITS